MNSTQRPTVPARSIERPRSDDEYTPWLGYTGFTVVIERYPVPPRRTYPLPEWAKP